MFWKVVTLVGLALGAQGEPHATSQQMVKKEFVRHGELNHIGSHLPEHHGEYAWAYPSYEFSYSVNDPHTHDIKGQREHRHGDEVKGEYWLLQPDGKTRTVKYHSNKHNGFKADVHYSEHHEHHHHPALPPTEEINKPVVEIVEEEPQKMIEESEPVIIEETPELVVEERLDEHTKPFHHKPIHIEYYINHKYRKHHNEESQEQHKPERAESEAERDEDKGREEESAGETGEEARIREDEVPREEIKYNRPVNIEYYSKIHHPIHNEHHGHELPNQILIRHKQRDERRGHKEKYGQELIRREEQGGPEERRRNEEHRGRDERGRGEQLSRETERERNEERSGGERLGRKEQRGRENREREEQTFPLPPMVRPLNVGKYHNNDREDERREPELHKPIYVEEIRAERKYDPHVQLLRMHKPVMFRPEHAHHPRDQRQQRKTQ